MLKEYRNIEENIIRDVRSLFRLKKLKKETNDTAINGIRNLFRLKKENKAIKDRIIRDIRNLFEHEEEKNYYKPVSIANFWSNHYIEYELNLNKIRPYLKGILNNLKISDTWKIQLTIAINFISSKDNDEECVMHSKSDNIEIIIKDRPDGIIRELFKPIQNRYQNNLEESIKSSEFVIDHIYLLYYKCH